ncbi:hypothetical protein [Neogemmobacter tilapiae]|uniref:Uncharacterized protein n=1 Tax=Neogemmobacter tilapiae TaxID=875041 RepID=A0A918TU43_9RHOB|nr:hypothetical protein [Gemmobacter tilapiae]GHC63451.1 hypothetical protein GCM10007315_29660 [Gemmobacter tilapiae]
MRFLLMLLMMGSSPVWAESPQQPLAVYATDNGSVPPEYHWEWRAEILPDGAWHLTYCKGYEETAPGCVGVSGTADAATVEAILQAARDSGLADRPALESEEVMVGGGLTRGRVMLEGRVVDLPSSPRKADVARVNAVLAAIAAAIPAEAIAEAEARAVGPAE